MKNTTNIFSCFLIGCSSVVLPFLAVGQEIGAPSLSIGTNEVLFAKGVLDTELIGEIITEKQTEIKKEFAKRIILNKHISEGPFLTYSYAENVLSTLLDHQEKGVMKKSLLELSTELALVLGVTEGYLRIKRGNTARLQRAFVAFVAEKGEGINSFLIKEYDLLSKYNPEKDSFATKDFPLFSEVIEIDANGKLTQGTPKHGVKSDVLSPKGIYLAKISTVYELKKLGFYEEYYLQSVLLDMFLEICRKNESLQKLGFFQTEFDEVSFANNSKYQRFINLGLGSESYKALVKQLKHVEVDAKKIIDLNLRYASVIIEQPRDALFSFDEDTLFDTLYEDFLAIEYDPKTLTDKEIAVIKQAGQAIYFGINNQRSKKRENNYDDIVLELRSVIPDLLSINPKVKDIDKIIKSIDTIADLLTKYQYGQFLSQLAALNEDSIYEANIKDNLAVLFKVITSLSTAESYDQVARLIVDVGDIFPFLNNIRLMDDLANLQKYLIVESDSNRVDVRVEDLVLYLHEKYISKASGAVSLYLTVGYNYLWNKKKDFDVSYASEKIGLKVKLFDNYKHTTYNSRYYYQKRKPVIYDVYLLGYVSGLLYQIEALKTEDSFNSPSYGLSVGLNFFNGLDLNIGPTWVEINGEKEVTANIGFDIPLGEYVSRLSQKRKK
jgi:hypothetical protein